MPQIDVPKTFQSLPLNKPKTIFDRLKKFVGLFKQPQVANNNMLENNRIKQQLFQIKPPFYLNEN